MLGARCSVWAMSPLSLTCKLLQLATGAISLAKSSGRFVLGGYGMDSRRTKTSTCTNSIEYNNTKQLFFFCVCVCVKVLLLACHAYWIHIQETRDPCFRSNPQRVSGRDAQSERVSRPTRPLALLA